MFRQERHERTGIGEALTAKAIVIWYESFICTPPSSRPLLCTSPGPHRYLSTCRFLYKMEVKFPKGFQRGKRRRGWILKKLVRFPLWPSGESENHTEGSRRIFAYFLSGEKVWYWLHCIRRLPRLFEPRNDNENESPHKKIPLEWSNGILLISGLR